ncbi:deoxyribonuclease IV [Candidatus Dependentiae bacterium]|nr:deoxyribonuclease IV [Candidatus Dependentiae bacterium]
MNSNVKKRNVGLHLKLKTNLSSLIEAALSYKIKIFQFFLTKEKTGKYLKLDNKDLKNFLKIRKQFDDLYIHSSYWINLASGKKIGYQTSQKLLKKEIELAKKLRVNFIVLHPGSASKFKSTPKDPRCRIKGIDNFTRALNKILKKENKVKILLENTAHSNRTIGSNLNDFKLIRNKLDFPEKIKFCIDFAHAFSYGYDIENVINFTKLLDKTMDLDNIKLIHLNDSIEKRGSRIDKHEIPGKGLIGEKILKKLLKHPKFNNKPIILELPKVTREKTLFSLKKVHSWL